MRESREEFQGAKANEAMTSVLRALDEGRLEQSLVDTEFAQGDEENARKLGAVLTSLNDQVSVRQRVEALLRHDADAGKDAVLLAALVWTDPRCRRSLVDALARADEFPDQHLLPYELAVLLTASNECLGALRASHWKAFVAGLEKSFERALAQYVADVALRIPGANHQQAEDIAQEVMTDLFKLDEPPVVKWKYVQTIARRRWVDRHRRAGERNEQVASDGAGPEAIVNPDVQHLLAIREQVLIGLRALAPEERSDFEKHYFDGMTKPEIARETGREVARVGASLRRARQKFREALPALSSDAGEEEGSA
jgi:RNA polymerase sigma factor (sigma-70 family)